MGSRRAVVINIVPSSVVAKTKHFYEEAELTEQFKDFLAEHQYNKGMIDVLLTVGWFVALGVVWTAIMMLSLKAAEILCGEEH